MATAKRLDPVHPSPEAAAALHAFQIGVEEVQHDSRAAGVPYAILDETRRLVFVHPDGTHRASAEPGSQVLG